MDRKKRMCTLLLATAIVFGIWSFTLAESFDFSEPRPGEMGYLHGRFHDLYMRLGRMRGGKPIDCCSGQDCRVTLDLKPPSAEEASRGVVGNVLVDGLWCPVSREQFVDLPIEVRTRGFHDPHVQDFQNRTHVCAGLTYVPFTFGDDSRPMRRKATSCPVIYCVKEGGAKS